MLSQGQLSNTTGSIYTVQNSAQIKTLIFFNGGVSSNTIAVYIVPNNGAGVGNAAAANQIINTSIASGDTLEFSPAYPFELPSNYSIQAGATNASQVNYFVMGVAN